MRRGRPVLIEGGSHAVNSVCGTQPLSIASEAGLSTPQLQGVEFHANLMSLDED